jgi:hypothetical protein
LGSFWHIELQISESYENNDFKFSRGIKKDTQNFYAESTSVENLSKKLTEKL